MGIYSVEEQNLICQFEVLQASPIIFKDNKVFYVNGKDYLL